MHSKSPTALSTEDSHSDVGVETALTTAIDTTVADGRKKGTFVVQRGRKRSGEVHGGLSPITRGLEVKTCARHAKETAQATRDRKEGGAGGGNSNTGAAGAIKDEIMCRQDR